MLASHQPSKEMVKHLEHYYYKLVKLSMKLDGSSHKAALETLVEVEGNMEAILGHALAHHPDAQVLEAALDFADFL